MFNSFCIPSHETFCFNKFKYHSGSSPVTWLELVPVEAIQYSRGNTKCGHRIGVPILWCGVP